MSSTGFWQVRIERPGGGVMLLGVRAPGGEQDAILEAFARTVPVHRPATSTHVARIPPPDERSTPMPWYTVDTGSEQHARYLQEAGARLAPGAGLRITDEGFGTVRLDGEALDVLRHQPQDANGHVQDTDYGPVLWIQGASFPVTEEHLP